MRYSNYFIYKNKKKGGIFKKTGGVLRLSKIPSKHMFPLF